MKWLCYLFSIT